MQIQISKFDARGYGVGYVEGREYKVLNAIPGEVLEVEVFKKKRGSRFAKVLNIINASPYRVTPKSTCFAETSPWEILDYKYENQLKQEYLERLLENANLAFAGKVDFLAPAEEKMYGYRNKMEFSFYIENGHISFAFHRRDCKRGKIIVENSPLMPDRANENIKLLLDIINQKQYLPTMPFKSLVVRYSFADQQTYLMLYVNDAQFDCSLYQNFAHPLSIFYSNPKSPASVETELLFTNWDMKIQETVGKQKFIYPYNSFFQINPAMFAEVVKDLQAYLSQNLNSGKINTLCEYYAGVGTLGIGIANNFKKTIAVELTSDSNTYAQINATTNNVTNYSLLVDKSENLAQEIKKHDTILFDPPRIGLHRNLIQAILEYKPQTLIYLSCNPETQMQNLAELKELYSIEYCKGYNFYPRTPHLENLVILKLRR